ncbi:contractile injection system tape measure protein [Dokdonia sp.]|uniref:contractile injection system tape measure protein n=1 Tax=Dokdonia sp. TaxID=2024995 RepID=UPI0032634378
MLLEQEHIINKVFLDVETNNVTVAHTLKDRLGVFLKEDILPYLENYFKSIEQELPTEIVQINQLHLEIQANDYNDFEALKTNAKEKLVEKINSMLKTPSQEKEMVLINTKQGKERSLLFFIEHGSTPWWETTTGQFQFTITDIEEVSASASFSNKLLQQLKIPASKKRCIHQFTDKELQVLLKAAFKNSKEVTFLRDEIIDLFKRLSPLSRVFIWSEMITYLQSKNETAFIIQLHKGLTKSTSSIDKSVYAFAKAVLAIVQQVFIIKKESVITLLQEKIKNTSQKEDTLLVHLISMCSKIGLTPEVNHLLASIQQDNHKVYKQLQESATETNNATTSFKEDQASLTKTEDIQTKSAPEETTQELQEDEIPITKNQLGVQNKNKGIDEISSENTAIKKEGTPSKLQEDIDTTTTQDIQSKNGLITNNNIRDVQEDQKVTHPDTIKKEEGIIDQKEPPTNQKTQQQQLLEKNQKEHSLKNILKEKNIDKDQKQKQSLENNKKEHSLENISKEKSTDKDLQQKQPSENGKKESLQENISRDIDIASQTESSERQQEIISKPLMDTYIKDIISHENPNLHNSGTHYVKNAGLIIVHPYLSHFFKNCGLLDDNNTITDQEVAVHALHYLATKKEQQIESYMVFEKFLCGVPIQKTIPRHIVLSDYIKEQAEELLESVIENWGVFNNASTDLICHEFLQREGKLSFTEDNPKIVIERKTQDILVDKLPWGIGICRLPWLDQLIFTNW